MSMPPLQSSNFSILKEVKFTNCSLFTDLAVLAYTKGLHFTMHTLLLNFNYWSVSKIAETNASRPIQRPQVPRPRLQNFGLEWSRDQDHGLEDYKTDTNLLWNMNGRCRWARHWLLNFLKETQRLCWLTALHLGIFQCLEMNILTVTI